MKIKNVALNVVKGDITTFEADALVNPAHTGLTMTRGLAAVIKSKGSGVIETQAVASAPAQPGRVVVTEAGLLPFKRVIHAVIGGADDLADQGDLRNAIAESLKAAHQLGLRSIVFPALGCGAGGFSPAGAAKILTQEVFRFAQVCDVSSVCEVRVCLLDDEMYAVFDATIRRYVKYLQEDLGHGPYVAVDMIIERPEGVVLIERANPPFGWALPGGFVEYGETVEDAACREAREETNLDLVHLNQFHTYSDPDRDPRFHTISTVFISQGEGSPESGDDAKGLKVVAFEDLPKLDYAFDHKLVIKEYLKFREDNVGL